MNKVILTVVLLVFSLKVFAQTCNQKAPPSDVEKMLELIGVWHGEFNAGDKTIALSIQFYKEDEVLKVKITNAGVIPGNTLADASLCSTNKFHFFGRSVSGESFTYNARLINGELIGDYKIGDSCSKESRQTFILRKKNL